MTAKERRAAKARINSRARYYANRESILAKARADYAANPEKKKAQANAYYVKNPGKVRASVAKWAAENPERRAEIFKNWKAANPERYKELMRQSREANREQRRGYMAEAQSKRRARTPLTGNTDTILTFYQQRDRLTNQLGIEFAVDHIIPIARGGEHHERNLQVMPANLNKRKNARILANPIWASPEFSLCP